MWILPKQLHTSPFVPDTEALISDLNEQSQACAQSLLVRSKPSPARTWSLKWKRDSWTALLSGRILKPSHGPSFTAAWTSSLAAIRASPSAQPASDSALKTHDTSGPTYQPELRFPTCCKTWQEWVTERRGAWRQRVNAVRLTRGKEFSSWPTATMQDGKQDGKQGGITPFQAKGGNHTNLLHVAAMQSWPTPNAQVSQDGESPETWLKRKEAMKAKGYNGNGCGTPLTIAVQLHGPAAPASSSSLGSRQGLWATPRANEPDSDPNFAARNADCGAHCHGSLSSQAKEMWLTPNVPNGGRVNPPDMSPTGKMPDGAKRQVGLENQARQWPTTSAGSSSGGQGLGLTGGSGNRNKLKHLCPEGMDMMQPSKLNPRWVETLMGLPIGWTMPSCTSPQTIAPMSCDSLVTELSLPPQSGPSEFSLAS